MNKLTQLIFGILVISLLILIASVVIKENVVSFGNINVNENAYSSAPVYSTSTLTNSVATLLLARATSSRTYAKICNPQGSDIVWIYKQSTSTNVVVNRGTPIYSSSTTGYPQLNSCITFDDNDPYMGGVYGIVSATSTVTIESIQE